MDGLSWSICILMQTNSSVWAKQGDAPEYNYHSPDNNVIQVKPHLRDLGVEISCDFTFKVHITKTVTAASRLVGWALRTFRRRGVGLMKTIWKSIIQPRLDYCSQLWSPDDQQSINFIEAVQHHFLAKVSGLENMNHWERLSRMSLYSQERRRERYMVIFIWKISEGLVHGYDLSFTDCARKGRLATPKQILRSAPAPIRRAIEASLAVKGCRLFNLLPTSIRNMKATSVDQFKLALDNFLCNVPDQPTMDGLGRAVETNSLLHQLAMKK